MNANKKGLAHLCAAFKNSVLGLRVAVRETAVRHELCLGLVHFVVLSFIGVGWMLSFVLSAIWVLILVVEILNTAIETVVDLVSPDYHELAGRAKDLGSLAVFLMLALYFISWFVVILKVVA